MSKKNKKARNNRQEFAVTNDPLTRAKKKKKQKAASKNQNGRGLKAEFDPSFSFAEKMNVNGAISPNDKARMSAPMVDRIASAGQSHHQGNVNKAQAKEQGTMNGVSTGASRGAGVIDATTNDKDGDGLKGGDDFISLNFDDGSEDESNEEGDDSRVEGEKRNVFANIAEKLGKFVEESSDPNKRKRDNGSNANGSRKRKQPQHDPYPWLFGKSYQKELEPTRILHRELLDFIGFVEPTEQEHKVRTVIVSRVRQVVQKKWPTASLHVFGSFDTKLYLPTSDIDLVVLSSEGEETYEKPNHLRRLANWLVKARIAENIQVITSARVPIIKFVDSVTKINVDISFNKPSGLVAAAVVKGYIEKMPAVRPLVIFVKHFLNMRGMNEVYLGGLGSYSIICMVVSFLQRHPKVATGQILSEENLGVLVVEFFELYGKRFNYDNVGISINGNGKYFHKLDRGWQRPGQSYLLSIEDPTDSDNDIAKSSFGILKVKSTFGGGHDFLVQRLYDVNDRIKARRRTDIGLDSVLSAVVSFDEEMKESRTFIASCYESKEIQDALLGMETADDLPDVAPTLRTVSSPGVRTSPSMTNAEFVLEDESDGEILHNDHDQPNIRGASPVKTPASNRRNVDGSSTERPAGSADHESSQHEVYLIESSDDEKKANNSYSDIHNPIELDSDADDSMQDSKVGQIESSARRRYWEANGKDETVQSDVESGSEEEA